MAKPTTRRKKSERLAFVPGVPASTKSVVRKYLDGLDQRAESDKRMHKELVELHQRARCVLNELAAKLGVSHELKELAAIAADVEKIRDAEDREDELLMKSLHPTSNPGTLADLPTPPQSAARVEDGSEGRDWR